MNLIDRAAALAGIGAVGLIFYFEEHNVLGPVDPTAPTSEIAENIAAGRVSGRLGAQLAMIGVFLVIVFSSRLYTALLTAAGRDSWLPITALAGGILLGGIVLLQIGFTFAATELDAYGDDIQIARMFALWGWNAATMYAPPLALLVASGTAVALTAESFPEWFRWASTLLLLAMLAIVALGAPGFATGAGFLWMILASLLLAIRPPAGAGQTAT